VSLVWLYAVASGTPPSAKGIEGRDVRAIEEAKLIALVSDVPEEAYEQSALDESVRDGAWLTPRATAHQDVCAAIHAATDAVLPVPFGTIYRSDDGVRAMLRERADELHAKLEQVRDRSEWVVALYRDTPQAAEHLSQVRDALEHTEPVTAGPGRRYLEERKSESARRADLRRLDEDATTAAQHAIGRVSKRSFEEPVADDSKDLVARSTYLVRRSDEGRLHDAIRGFNADWQERGYELRATGPWPPYRTAA
jgi:hypothetical protein